MLAGTSGVSTGEGWDTEDIEIPEEHLLSSDAKALMEEAKAGNVEELQVPNKVDPLCQLKDQRGYTYCEKRHELLSQTA